MIICEKCRDRNKTLTGYTEFNTSKIHGLKRVKCSGCNETISGRFWIKTEQIKYKRIKVAAAI